MKILLTSNKTYRGVPDSAEWYIYQPLQELGHEVFWYDTVNPEEKDYVKVIEKFKPDLIFCCMTGDKSIAPYEPWHPIENETKTGRTKTFNWFCDDTWRFETFSRQVCRLFNVCSTPEPSYLGRYREYSYENIILGAWHANANCYPEINFREKIHDATFIGAPNPAREWFLKQSKNPVTHMYGLSQEDLFKTHSNTKIGINLSFNVNDSRGATQMKQRLFEVPAGGGLLVTEYHEGIEEFFDIDKEVVSFREIGEFNAKMQFLLSHPSTTEKMAAAGHRRFLAEHDSKHRLSRVLQQIGEI